MRYSPEVQERFRNPRHAGRLDADDRDVGTGEALGPGSGERVRLQLRCDAAGRIAQVRFKAFGCPATIACASLAAEALEGRTLAEAAALHETWIADELALTDEQAQLAGLPIEALRAALAELAQKSSR